MFVLAILAALAIQQSPAEVDRNCLDDDHTNRCDAVEQARVRALLGVAAIEDEAATGSEIYRAFFVDGYGRDMPAVSFERRSGEPPKIVVLGEQGARLEGQASAETWAAVVSASRLADRVLVPLEPNPDEEVICLHSWVTTVELANSQPDFDRVPVRRRTESSCDGSLTTRFAHLLADLALKDLPSCAVLDPAHSRNSVTLLETCLDLEGDTMAAAELWNQARIPYENTEAAWRTWLGYGNVQPRIDWAGEVVQETNFSRLGDTRPPPDAAAFLKDRLGSVDFYSVFQNRVAASTSADAQIDGVIELRSGGQLRVADYRQVWRKEDGFDWQLASWTIEPFKVVD